MVAEVLDTVADDAGSMSLLRSVEVVVVEEPQRLYRVGRAPEERTFAEACRSHARQVASTLRRAATTYSIFDGTGNLVEAFNDRAVALECLAGIAQAEPRSASEVFLITQDDDGNANTVPELRVVRSVS